MNWLQLLSGSRAPAVPGGPLATGSGGMFNGWPTMLQPPSQGALPPLSGSRAVVPYTGNPVATQGTGGSQGLIRSILTKIPGLLSNPYTAGAAALGGGAAGTAASLSSVNNGLAKDNLMMDPEMGIMPLAPSPPPRLPPIPAYGSTPNTMPGAQPTDGLPQYPAYGSTPMPTAQSMPMPHAAPGVPGAPGVPLPPRRPPMPVSPWGNPDAGANYYNGPGGSSFGAGDPTMGPQGQNFNVGALGRFFGQ